VGKAIRLPYQSIEQINESSKLPVSFFVPLAKGECREPASGYPQAQVLSINL
jgi:hypothetical protein